MTAPLANGYFDRRICRQNHYFGSQTVNSFVLPPQERRKIRPVAGPYLRYRCLVRKLLRIGPRSGIASAASASKMLLGAKGRQQMVSLLLPVRSNFSYMDLGRSGAFRAALTVRGHDRRIPRASALPLGVSIAEAISSAFAGCRASQNRARNGGRTVFVTSGTRVSACSVIGRRRCDAATTDSRCASPRDASPAAKYRRVQRRFCSTLSACSSSRDQE